MVCIYAVRATLAVANQQVAFYYQEASDQEPELVDRCGPGVYCSQARDGQAGGAKSEGRSVAKPVWMPQTLDLTGHRANSGQPAKSLG